MHRMDTSEYIPARKSQLNFFKNVALYQKVEDKGFVLYKRSGLALHDISIDQDWHPKELFIRQSEKIKGIQETQRGFNRQLEAQVKSNNYEKIKETLVTIMEETLTEPRSGSLEGFSDTMEVLVSDYSKESDVIKKLIDMSYDYSTVLHSINVMAFVLGYAFCMNYSKPDSKTLGLCALLHDVGKTRIDQKILKAPRKLTVEEFEEIKSHTTYGYDILCKCKFNDKQIATCALEHHEKMDGSGYPGKKTRISKAARIIGLIDCYEALTNDDRPYRDSMEGFNALNKIIGEEVKVGKYDKKIYVEFIKSLAA